LWNDRLRIAERVAADWAQLDTESRLLARKALEELDEDPITGAPLFPPLRGFWSYRTGNLRIVYSILPEARFIAILKIERVESSVSETWSR